MARFSTRPPPVGHKVRPADLAVRRGKVGRPAAGTKLVRTTIYLEQEYLDWYSAAADAEFGVQNKRSHVMRRVLIDHAEAVEETAGQEGKAIT